jgi:hypothetical protein
MSPIAFGNSQPRSSTQGYAYRVPLLNGEPGPAQTIALMRKLVDEALAESATPKKLGVGSRFGGKQVSPELFFGCSDTGHCGWEGCAETSGE